MYSSRQLGKRVESPSVVSFWIYLTCVGPYKNPKGPKKRENSCSKSDSFRLCPVQQPNAHSGL